MLTPLELIDNIAALVPPPRTHRHLYYGVLVPNAPLRAAVTALAPMAVRASSPPSADAAGTKVEPCRRAVWRYLWVMLLARIYAAYPLTCPICLAEMWIIAFINATSTERKIQYHLGESTRPPRFAPVWGPPLWEAAAASVQAGIDPQWDLSAQPVP